MIAFTCCSETLRSLLGLQGSSAIALPDTSYSVYPTQAEYPTGGHGGPRGILQAIDRMEVTGVLIAPVREQQVACGTGASKIPWINSFFLVVVQQMEIVQFRLC